MRAKCLLEGDFVVTPDGVGMIEVLGIRYTLVKFGASGPIQEYPWRILRQATEQEVMDAGLDGVGHNPYRGEYSTDDSRRKVSTRGTSVPPGWSLDRTRPSKVVRIHRNPPRDDPQPSRPSKENPGA